MKERLLSIVGAVGGGLTTYIETSGSDIMFTLIVALVCGIFGYFGNECGKLILRKIKATIKHKKFKLRKT